MGIRVVDSASVGRRRIGIGRLALALLGWVLVLVGLLVAVPLFGLIVTVILVGDSSAAELGWPSFWACIGGAAVIAGRRIVRGKRRMILFLRRFGFTGSSRALSFAVGTAVGRRFRAVTLDDMQLSPVGGRRSTGLLWAIVSVAGMVLLVLVVRGIVGWLGGDQIADVFDSAFESTRSSAAQGGANAFGAIVGGLIGAVFITLIIGIVALSLLTVMLAVIGSTVAVSTSSWLGVLRAEMARRTYVRDSDEIERAAGSVAGRARGIFAPRLVVVSSASSVWRDVVVRLAAASDIILIDVSVPSANLLWEVSTLGLEHGHRRILIVESDSVADLTDGAESNDATRRLIDLLDGEEVLAYGTGSRAELRQFAKALRSRCETTVAANQNA
ncbi:MAG TPA: hypothetical protein VMM79_00755 [Longimicrobiales bacterium]|nr:hypothetical protein [Longimicrobiales bacterium]